MGFDSTQNVYVKENSPVESSSRNTTYTTSRTDSHTNHSFKGKRETITNSRSNVSSNRSNNEASGSSQQLTYQSNHDRVPVNSVMDSGYGSLDKLKMDGSSQMRSPVLMRRLSNKMAKQTVKPNSFDSDDGGSDGRESSGFVNVIGVTLPMKDTAYDYVRKKN